MRSTAECFGDLCLSLCLSHTRTRTRTHTRARAAECFGNRKRERETPHAPNDETDSSTGRVRETLQLTHEQTVQHRAFQRDSHAANDEADFKTGRVGETHDTRRITKQIPERGMGWKWGVGGFEIDSSTGRVRETLHPTNDQRDSSTEPVRKTRKRDSPLKD